jgi:hypothetical protein
MVQQLGEQELQAEAEGNFISGGLTFFTGVNTGGILDFKNTMGGQGYSVSDGFPPFALALTFRFVGERPSRPKA